MFCSAQEPNSHVCTHRVIPKSTSAARLKENLDVFDFALTADDMVGLAKLNINRRYNDPIVVWGQDIFA